MTSVKTSEITDCIKQIEELINVGCRIIRISTPTIKDVTCFRLITLKFTNLPEDITFIADVHYDLKVAIEASKVADKVRINPGNFLSKNELNLPDIERKNVLLEKLKPLIESCKKHNTSLRIGVNHGSIYKGNVPMNTSEDLLESMIEYLEVLDELNFENVVLSIKSSDPWTMIDANLLLKEHLESNQLNYPIHLGVTEAGSAIEGRVKSAIGIGLCLLQNVGDTIRVSLTEDPIKEIPVANAIINSVEVFNEDLKRLLLSTESVKDRQQSFLFDRPILIHETSDEIVNGHSGSWKGDLFVDDQQENLLHIGNTDQDTYNLKNFVPFSENMPLNEGQYVLVEEAGLIDCVAFLKRMKLNLPILVKLRFENTDTDIARNAILYASLLRKGIIHGLYLTSKNAEDFKFQGMLAAEVFQVSGVRNVKSSIVSCPGCSRSNINLEFLSEEVRKRLSQNKLKVSIMGCAVNGYGEMMKSDLGLIGVGTGKVDIYREKVLVKSAVKESLVGDFIEEYIKIKQ